MPVDFEFWQLLLIPVFFGLGWFAARIDIRHLVSESRALPRSYFRGVNFLLNEEPDKAIEAFTDVVTRDPQTVELNFALGSLFRRRGDLERAIRIHQGLLSRETLPQDLRLQAISAIGQDYLRAGLLDRAEESFQKLQGTALEMEAKRHLLHIFQLEKEWKKAIDIARELPDYASQKDISHFWCELAALAINQSRPQDAAPFLESALLAHRRSVRANMLLGDMHQKLGAPEKALEAWQRIEQQNPAYLAIVAQRLLDTFKKIGQSPDGLQLLKGYLSSYPSLDLLETVFNLVMEKEGVEAALQLIKDELRRNPTLLGLDKLLETQLVMATPERRADLELVKSIIHSQTRRLARYRCESCGFKAKQFHWRCPACGGWETYPPRRTEEFDHAP